MTQDDGFEQRVKRRAEENWRRKNPDLDRSFGNVALEKKPGEDMTISLSPEERKPHLDQAPAELEEEDRERKRPT